MTWTARVTALRGAHWLFDDNEYRRQFARVYGRDLDLPQNGDAYGHFLRIGQFDQLSGHRLFDPAVYRDMAPYGVACRIPRIGPFTAFLLHIKRPGAEPVTSHLFDPSWYLRRYPEAAKAVAAKRFESALHHYLANETPTDFDPSPRFSDARYLAMHEDVARAVAAGEMRNGFAHYLSFGRLEARRFFPAADNAMPVLPLEIAARTDFPLQTREFDHVTLLPCRHDGSGPNGYSFGVLDGQGDPISAFAHPWCGMRRAAEPPATDPQTFIYGGLLMDHFGHVLRDSLASLWCMRRHPRMPVLWHWIDLPVPHAHWAGWLDAMWVTLGLDQAEHIRITEPMRVARLILPESGLIAADLLHESQVAALAVHPAPPQTGRRLWLSRRLLPARFGRLEGEAELEAILAQRGWDVVHPETLPIPAQADLFAASAVVAGFMGSAFHAALLSAAPRAKMILVRRPGLGTDFYRAVAEARGLEQHFITPQLNPYADATAWTTFEISDPPTLADAICRGAA